ncbi:MAG: chorismate mutase [Coriobacteriia bacterium]|nr:chorismate mutase [Coriobacteriia bacterium]
MTTNDTAAAERIAQIRAEIDEIDGQLVELLNKRAECSLEIRHLKPVVHWGLYDPAREEEIFVNLAKHNKGPLFADNLREIYSAILHVMKELRG